MGQPYLVAGARTPVGKFLGALSSFSAPQLAAQAIAAVLQRSGAPAQAVQEVILGQVLPAGSGQAPARQAALQAGLPASVPAMSVNKVCGSGLKAVMLAATAIRAGEAQLVLAGGMESMSQAPYLLPRVRTGWKYGHRQCLDHMLHDGLWCAYEDRSMGQLAEYTARKYQVSRQQQDRYAALSHARAVQAWQQGAFAPEVVSVRDSQGRVVLDRDEGPRPDSSEEKLAQLPPAFDPQGTVTAGNSSQLSDGAAAVLVADESWRKRLNGAVVCRIVDWVTVATEPKELFIAPALALRRLAQNSGVPLEEVHLFEINEAFAAQTVACLKQLNLPEEKVNVHGGAVALGHPIGASGARVLVTLMHALAQREKTWGAAALCLGGGEAVAMLVQRET